MVKQIYYIGSMYPDDKVQALIDMGSAIDFAADTFQKSLIRGFDNLPVNLNVISSPYISNFPKVRRLSFPKETWNYPSKESNGLLTGFINLPILKHFSKFLRISKMLRKRCVEGNGNVILIYSIHSPYLLSLYALKRHRIKTCLIVPDLPQYMSAKKDVFYRLGKILDRRLINIGLKRIDSFVLFSEKMKDKLPITNKPWITIEGIISNKEEIIGVNKHDNKVVLYTGSLDKRYGILDLLEAFHGIQYSDYELWICGGGDAQKDVIRYASIDTRIVYKGMLPHEQVVRLQKGASVLINPRRSCDVYTKYSFPSKTMEYMASGTPTLMSKLSSIPQEYSPYVFFFDDESVEGIRKKILEVTSKPKDELEAFGKQAKEFILNNKNEKKQSEKLYKLICSL